MSAGVPKAPRVNLRTPAPYIYAPQPLPMAAPVAPAAPAEDAGFWEKYKIWIIAFAAIAIGLGIYFYMKSRQDEQERLAKRERLQLRYKAEQYAEQRAEQLAREQLQQALEKRGIRHDIGDPGIQSDLGASHDWETNTEQKASPQGIATTTKINQTAAPISQPYEPDPADELDPLSASGGAPDQEE